MPNLLTTAEEAIEQDDFTRRTKMRAIFEGIYNPQTANYLHNSTNANEIETLLRDGVEIVGVIHSEDDTRELTFSCAGDGLAGVLPESWVEGWREASEIVTEAEILESLLGRWSDRFSVDPDYWDGCPYTAFYPVNENEITANVGGGNA